MKPTAGNTRLGVVDLGTNTFHLLIAEPNGQGGFRELFRYRQFVKLAEEGIQVIGETPFQRGLVALQGIKAKLDEYGVDRVRAFGTAALRTASNGSEFIRQVRAATGIEIQLITGDEEARLIHLGVVQAVPLDQQRRLIMDIGGGSVEFIIADRSRVFWAQSFPVGVAVLFTRFHHHNPISAPEMAAVQRFLDEHLEPLCRALDAFPTHHLIGAAGTFDVIETLLAHSKPTPHSAIVALPDFYPLYFRLLEATVEERRTMEGVPEERVDMIVVAMILIDYVIRLSSTRELTVSSFALKEGMLWELLGL